MTLEELKDIVRTLIGRAKTEEAIKKIIKWAKDIHREELENEIVILEGDLTKLNRNIRIGLLSNSEIGLNQRKINSRLLDLLDSVEENNTIQESSNPKSSNPRDVILNKATSTGAPKVKPDFGAISYGIPSKMQLDNLHRCIIRVALDKNILLENMPYLEGTVIKDNIRLGEKMSATFIPSESFSITAINDNEQLIDEYGATEWNFDVRPLETGKFPLTFKVSIIFENGVKQVVLTESVIVGIEPTATGMEWKVDSIAQNNEDNPNEDSPSNNRTSKEIKILMLTANPARTTKLNLDEEYAVIGQKLQQKQDYFNIILEKAVSGSEFKEFTQREQPDILHFSGHGEGGKYAGIVVQNNDKNESALIPIGGLKALFKFFKKKFNIKVVLLNACHTQEQAATISKYVEYVIGTNVAIGDDAASAFSSGFYFQLVEDNKMDIEFAFESGRAEAAIQGAKEENFVIYRNGELLEIA